MRTRPIILASSLLALTAGAASAEAPVTVDRLFADTAVRAEPELTNTQIQGRVVTLSDGALEAMLGGARGAEVAIELFEGRSLTATTDKLETTEAGDITWRGRFDSGGHAVLVRRDGETAGFIRADGRVYEVLPRGNGQSLLARVHVNALPGCAVENHIGGNPIAGPGLREAIAREAEAEPMVAEARAEAAARGALPDLKQIVAYTPNALSQLGNSESAMSAFIDGAIEDMNTVLENSQITMTTSAADKVLLTENETGDAFGDRNAFRIDGDGKWDEIHDLRDLAGADVAHILVRDSNACGIAAMIYDGQSNADELAFCLTAVGCVSNLTFTHEVGHLVGCAHDFTNAGGIPGTFSYSFGWRDPEDETWRTVMSYAPGIRTSYFSTPDVNSPFGDGLPLGDPVQANNAQTINLNIPVITQWRGTIGPAPDMVAASPRAGAIDISWNAVPDATAYDVWRGPTPNPLQSAVRGFVDDGSLEYADTSANPGQTYYYFVRSRFIDGGASDYSAPVEATAVGGVGPDITGDGNVNSADLGVLLAEWGSPGADLTGDGTTNSADLGVLLAAWGS